MRILIYFMLLNVVFFGCKSPKKLIDKTSEVYLKVQDIEEYDFAYKITSINSKNVDTIVIISYKENFFNKYKLEKPKLSENKNVLEKNETYNFDLIKVKPQVSTMEQFGAFLIVENDTILKSKSAKSMPKIFIGQNTIGKTIYE